MRAFGYEVSIRKAAVPQALSGVDERGTGRWSRFFEWMPGSFQSDIEVKQHLVLAQATVFACMTLIAGDLGKLRLKLMEQQKSGIWQEISSAAFSPVLRKPNSYQTRQKFIEQWVISKLSAGNTYALKARDGRGVVTSLYILDPTRTHPLVAPDGSVYYSVQADDLTRVPEGLEAVPASEMIHDRMVCLFHPLVGVTPIFACGLAATQALKIQNNSARFFENMSRPGGILTAPGQISDATAARLKDYWEQNYRGNNLGKIAVLGDALSYTALTVSPVDADLVSQLKLSAEQVCSTFHVPAYMVGAAAAPAYNNVEALNQQYYSQCLQTLIESAESCLDEGLGLTEIPGRTLGTEFELDDLLKMDTATQIDALNKAVGGGWMAPDEARAKRNMTPVAGGKTPYLQQQNYSLAALDKRDRSPDPFGKTPAPAPALPAPVPADPAAKEAFEDLRAAVRRMEARSAEEQRERDESVEFVRALARAFDAQSLDDAYQPA